jgi:hypothetical protein
MSEKDQPMASVGPATTPPTSEHEPLDFSNGQRFGILGGALLLGLGLSQLIWPSAAASFAGFGPNPATLALGIKGTVLGLVMIGVMFIGHARAQSAVALLATALSAAEVAALIMSESHLAYLSVHLGILACTGLATLLLTIRPR